LARLKLEGRALTWWESYVTARRLKEEPPVTQWEIFKNFIKLHLYPIGYEKEQRIQ
jgi:hypothetical protein